MAVPDPYATFDDLAERFDVRVVLDLSTDTGEPRDTVAGQLNVEADNTTPNEKIPIALRDASGEMDMVLLGRGRYTREQLDDLFREADPDLTANPPATSVYAASKLKQICCSLAVSLLIQRRLNCNKDLRDFARELADKAMEDLGDGSWVIPIEEAVDASLPELSVVPVASIEFRNNMSTRARRFFPQHEQRHPGGNC